MQTVFKSCPGVRLLIAALCLAVLVRLCWLMTQMWQDRPSSQKPQWGSWARLRSKTVSTPSSRAFSSMGVNVFRYKLLSFSVGAFFAGVGGALLASLLTTIDPKMFLFTLTFNVLMQNRYRPK